jgi:hypothetical protein
VRKTIVLSAGRITGPPDDFTRKPPIRPRVCRLSSRRATWKFVERNDKEELA